MNDILLMFTLLIESLTVLQCIQVIFMQKFKLDRYSFGFVFVDIIVYLLINETV